MHELYYVRAASIPNRYYAVTLGPRGWSCECKGFQYRHDCGHITAVCAGFVPQARPKASDRAALALSLYA